MTSSRLIPSQGDEAAFNLVRDDRPSPFACDVAVSPRRRHQVLNAGFRSAALCRQLGLSHLQPVPDRGRRACGCYARFATAREALRPLPRGGRIPDPQYLPLLILVGDVWDESCNPQGPPDCFGGRKPAWRIGHATGGTAPRSLRHWLPRPCALGRKHTGAIRTRHPPRERDVQETNIRRQRCNTVSAGFFLLRRGGSAQTGRASQNRRHSSGHNHAAFALRRPIRKSSQ